MEATFWRIDEASQWKSEFLEVLFLLQGSPRPCVSHGVGRGSLEELSAQLPAFCTVSASKKQPSQSLASGDTGLSQDPSVGVLSPEGEPATSVTSTVKTALAQLGNDHAAVEMNSSFSFLRTS